MKNFWNHVPGFRILLPVTLGIGLEIYFDFVLNLPKPGLWLLSILALVALAPFSLIHAVKPILPFRIQLLNGLVFSVLLVWFGYVLSFFYTEKNYRIHFSNFLQPGNVLVAKISKPPLEKGKSEQVVAQVISVIYNGQLVKTDGSILLTLFKDSLAESLDYGELIVFNSRIQEFQNPQNPLEFNFKLYQGFHNVYHRAFLKPGDWRVLSMNQGNVFFSEVYSIREYFLSLIKRYVTDRNDLAVASAIMLGYNDYLNGEVMQAYASSGALHVLSVSGLHVGIIFMMLNFLFGWMESRGRSFVVAKAFIIIILIWFYACLTGLSPSVLRSAAMFTMIQVGMTMVRHVNMYNVIATSALVLILFNPYIVTEVGFRLSYLAVLGIIYLYPKIYSLLAFKNSLADQGWKLVAVSIAAQVTTFPLSLYYFHQFPNLFLVSNLLVIPWSNFILITGTSLFFVGEIPYLNTAVGWCFETMLHILDQFIFFIDSIWFALIKGISITMIEMLAIYLLIFLLCWLMEERRTKVLIASLFIVFGLSSFNAYEALQKSNQKELVVYSVPKSKAVAFIDGERVSYDFDDKLLCDESSMLFRVRHHWWDCAIATEEKAMGQRLGFGTLYLFEGKKVLIVDSAVTKHPPLMKSKLNADLIILSNNATVYLEGLQNMVEFDELVFDSSNSRRRVYYWKKDCASLKLKYWDVSEQGAYMKSLSG